MVAHNEIESNGIMVRNKAGSHKLRVRLLVRQIAESRGYNRTKLARASDVQYATINNIWNKPDTEVTLLVLLKIARALHVNMDVLYDVIEDD